MKESKVIATTMSKAYQITVPSVVRKVMGLVPGDPVEFRLEGRQIVLARAETHEEKVRRAFAKMDEWRDSLPDETKEKIKQYAGWTVNQYHAQIDNLPKTKAYLKEKYGV